VYRTFKLYFEPPLIAPHPLSLLPIGPPHFEPSLCRVSIEYLEQQVRYLLGVAYTPFEDVEVSSWRIPCPHYLHGQYCFMRKLGFGDTLVTPYYSITLNNSKRRRTILTLVHENGRKDQLAIEPLIPEQDTCRLATEPPTVDWALSSRPYEFIFRF
jgi:hypothetical protein